MIKQIVMTRSCKAQALAALENLRETKEAASRLTERIACRGVQIHTVDRLFESTVSQVYDLMEDASTDEARPPVARDRLEEMKDVLDALMSEFAEYLPFD